jgi:uncharacterized protein YukE
MDRLDHVAGDAARLLRRVDEILTVAGAPPTHPVWAALRRVRLLPADAVDAVAALHPAALDETAPDLRVLATRYADVAESLPAPGAPQKGWSGEAADAYDAARRQLGDHLSGDPESLAERLEASADLVDALVDWMRRSRAALAGALAQALGSAEAVTLLTGASAGGDAPAPAPEAQAAADIAERVLHTIAEAYDEGAELLEGAAHLAVPADVPTGAGARRSRHR